MAWSTPAPAAMVANAGLKRVATRERAMNKGAKAKVERVIVTLRIVVCSNALLFRKPV